VNEFLPFIVSGLASGALYGLAGTGLVLTYRTSGIFNFGYGALATVAAYLFYYLHYDRGVDWGLAFAVSVFVAGPVMGAIMEVFTRHLAPQRTAMKIVGTVGIILLVQGVASIMYGQDHAFVEPYLPNATDSVEIGGTNVTYQQITIFVVAVLAVGGFYLFFRYSRSGVAMRSVVDDPDLVALHGVNAVAVRRSASIVGCTFAALTGVLILPIFGLDAIILTFLVLQAVGAAALGMFSSIPLTFAGGLLIGVVADISKKYVVSIPTLSGFPGAVPFIALFLVLLLLPRRRLVLPSRAERRPPLPWTAPLHVRVGVGVVLVTFLALVPTFAGTKQSYWTIGIIQAILLLSLGLLVRTSGQVSLCHATFAAIGAVAFSQFSVGAGMPWLVALLLGALVVVPVAAIVAIPAIRLSGLYLALATFAFALMVERLFYGLSWMFTATTLGRPMPRPSFGGSDEGFYYVCLAFAVAVSLLILLIHKARLGRLLRGLSDSPTALATAGLSVNVTRVLVFCISGFLAGIAGILYGVSVNTASTTDVRYQSFTSLVLICMLAIAPFAAPWYAFVAVLGAVIPGYISGDNTTLWLNALFGLFAILIALQGGPQTMPPKFRAAFDRLRLRRGEEPPQPATSRRGSATVTDVEARSGLVVEGLTVRFGGLMAVDNLGLRAPTGRITGLIGPNGAGKTTTFNACSGLTRPTSGRITLHGADVSRLKPAARSRHGLGRTFQRTELCETLTVEQNVALGRESSMAGAHVLSQLAGRRRDQRLVDEATREAMQLCGITYLAKEQAGALSTGQRRLVELARCLAGPFDLLLLDEPSSGLDREETSRFGDVLNEVVQERRCGILLVEHDMSLVLQVCQYIYVLDFGELIFEGDPDKVVTSPLVKAAYLGDDAVEAQLPHGQQGVEVP
jgi:ABC-type branched-subunit amino acid transport system ATPase component/branched-subunit amino acid ABC-type transport system permease component